MGAPMILLIVSVFNCALTYLCSSLYTAQDGSNDVIISDSVEFSEGSQIFAQPVIMQATVETYVLTDHGYFDEKKSLNVLSFKLPSKIFHSHAIEFKFNIKVTPSSMVRSIYTTNVRDYIWYLNRQIVSAKLSDFGKEWIILDLRNNFFKQKRRYRHMHFFSSRKNFFLRVELTCKSSKEAKLQEKSYLSIIMPKKFKNRAKRSSTQFCKENQKTCCLRTTKMSLGKFFDVSNILHPYNGIYDIHYCDGECPGKSNHNLKERDAITGNLGYEDKPCCVANTFDSLNFIFIQNSSVIERTIKDFSAKSCGCT